MSGNIKFIFGVALLSAMIWGLCDIFIKNDTNSCEMTYMYEYPEYIPIEVNSSARFTQPSYSLYAYGEGKYAANLKRKKFNGIPVLFIPGNSGSYKQVRSLGSVSYRKTKDKGTPYHFDYFSVDLNEDHGALFGPALEAQLNFVIDSIRTIATLYRKPTKVILVGHSIGGVVARAVVMKPEVAASDFPLIITQASPHFRPVVVNDAATSRFYKDVNIYWEFERLFDLRDVVLVSVGGGAKDIQVPDFLTTTPLADVDTSLQSVPGCWLTTDHLAVVWCKQLVLATVRALFDSVDPATNNLYTDRNKVVDAFNYHLVERSAGKSNFPVEYPPRLKLSETAHWSEVIKRQYHYAVPKSTRDTFVMIPIKQSHKEYEHLTIIGHGIEWKNWVFVCKANVIRENVRMCSSGDNLSQLGRVIPAELKEINLDLKEFKKNEMSHVVIWVQSYDDVISIEFDTSSAAGRQTNVSVPAFSSFDTVGIIDSTPVKALSLNISVIGMNRLWQSYVLHIERLNGCSSDRTPIVSFSTEWNSRWEYLVRRGISNSFDYVLELSLPSKSRNDSDAVNVHVVLDPKCIYKMSLSMNFQGVFRRLCLLYGVQVPAFVAAHFLLVLAAQCKSLASEERSALSPIWILFSMSPIAIVPFVRLNSWMLSFAGIETDMHVLSKSLIDLEVLQFVLFLSSLPVSVFLFCVVWAFVFLFGKGAYAYAKRFMAHFFGMSSILPLAEVGLSRIPFLLAGLLISISFGTCGAVGLTLAAGLYFGKLFKDYEDYAQSLVFSAVGMRMQPHSLSSIHVHLTVFMLTLVMAALNIPSLIMWLKGINTSTRLNYDPSLAICLVTLIALGFLWQKDISPHRKYYKQLGYLVHFAAVLVILFGCVNLYRVSFIVAVTLLIISMHQILSPVEIEVPVSAEPVPIDNTASQSQESESQEAIDSQDPSHVADQSGSEDQQGGEVE